MKINLTNVDKCGKSLYLDDFFLVNYYMSVKVR